MNTILQVVCNSNFFPQVHFRTEPNLYDNSKNGKRIPLERLDNQFIHRFDINWAMRRI